MDAPKIIFYNVILLVVGLSGFIYLLNYLEETKGDGFEYLNVRHFGQYYQESKIPDSLKTTKCFLVVYDVFINTESKHPIDTFINRLNANKLTLNKFSDSIVKEELKLVKLYADHHLMSNRYENRNKYTISYIEVIIAMGLAGLLGAILSNFRGFFEYYREKSKFPKHLIIPYLLRPYTGLICGILSYFLATIITGSLTDYQRTSEVSFNSMISFLGFAILAGFASQEFTERLKTAAGALFGISQPLKEDNKKTDKSDQKEDNKIIQDSDPEPPSFPTPNFINRD